MSFTKVVISMFIAQAFTFNFNAHAGGRDFSQSRTSSKPAPKPAPPKPAPAPKPTATPFVGGTVNCSDAAVQNGPVIWSFGVKTTKSMRLNSDILYNKDNVVTFISSFNVAQYMASAESIYMLIDDINENPTIAFSATKPVCRANFSAKLQEYDATGKVILTKNLVCTVAQ